MPTSQSLQDLFSPNLIPQFYSLERYHIHGSRILSRSFQVQKWDGEDGAEDQNAAANTSADSHSMDVGDTSIGSGMDVDEDPALVTDASHAENENSDDEDEVDASDVTMVPMADMLNARYGSENVRDIASRSEYNLVS